MKYPSHFAIESTIGVLRMFAILTCLGTLALALGVANIRSVIPQGVVVSGGGAALLIFIVGLIYAVVSWALADALQLLIDADDAHIRLESKVDYLVRLEERATTTTGR